MELNFIRRSKVIDSEDVGMIAYIIALFTGIVLFVAGVALALASPFILIAYLIWG